MARLTRQYRTLLAERAPQVAVPFQSDPSEPACHLLPVVLPSDCDRGQVMAAMKEEGIQTSDPLSGGAPAQCPSRPMAVPIAPQWRCPSRPWRRPLAADRSVLAARADAAPCTRA